MKQKNRNYYINAKTVKEQSLIVYLYQISTSQLYLPFFYSFPKCNAFNLKSEDCIDYTDDEYEAFLSNKSHPFLFKLSIDTVDIDINNYTNKYISANETDSIYLDKKEELTLLLK